MAEIAKKTENIHLWSRCFGDKRIVTKGTDFESRGDDVRTVKVTGDSRGTRVIVSTDFSGFGPLNIYVCKYSISNRIQILFESRARLFVHTKSTLISKPPDMQIVMVEILSC